MTPDEQEAQEGIRQAKRIAEHLGAEIVANTDSTRVGIYAAAITYAGMCAMHGVSLHSAIDVLMGLYKQLDQDSQDMGPMQ